MMHLMKNLLAQLQIKSSYVIYMSVLGPQVVFRIIWLVKQCKVRSFLKLLSIIDFHPVHLAILLVFFCFFCLP